MLVIWKRRAPDHAPPSRVLAALLALACAAVASLFSLGAALTAPAEYLAPPSGQAQTIAETAPMSGPGALPAASGAVSSRVFAAVRPPRPGRGDGAWRIEFGFLPEAVLTSGSGSKSAAVEAHRRLLPAQRFVSETALRRRAADGNRRWMNSSKIEIDLAGGGSVAGRVIVRWNPPPRGTFRLEFGFLPEAALSAAGGAVQTAAATGALLPSNRYLSEQTIAEEQRRSAPRWLFSPVIEAPAGSESDEPGVSENEDQQEFADCGETAAAAGRIVITQTVPLVSLPKDEPISPICAATISGSLTQQRLRVWIQGLPSGLEYKLLWTKTDPPQTGIVVSGRIAPHEQPGPHRLQITVRLDSGESASGEIEIRVEPLEAIRIAWDGYEYSTASIDARLTARPPRVLSPTPAPAPLQTTYSASSGSSCSVDNRSGEVALNSVGVCEVVVTVAAAGYEPGSATARVTAIAGPEISWSGYPAVGVEPGRSVLPIAPPTALADGRVVQLQYSYSTDPSSASVCSVDPNNGALTLIGTGACTVIVASAPTAQYSSAQLILELDALPQPNRAPELTESARDPIRLLPPCHGRPAPPHTENFNTRFRDPDGDTLTFRVRSVSGPLMTTYQDSFIEVIVDDDDFFSLAKLFGWKPGRTSIIVAARDPQGLSVEVELTVTVVECPPIR